MAQGRRGPQMKFLILIVENLKVSAAVSRFVGVARIFFTPSLPDKLVMLFSFDKYGNLKR